jgi:hypothetical protein
MEFSDQLIEAGQTRQAMYRTYNVTLRLAHATIVVVGKQRVLHSLCVHL